MKHKEINYHETVFCPPPIDENDLKKNMEKLRNAVNNTYTVEQLQSRITAAEAERDELMAAIKSKCKQCGIDVCMREECALYDRR